ncbi:MAG: hypothetical protein QOK37_4257 [Thermoanaerobaculia bacterium]|jgi:hypothetical protein|nr:hypothetical protein [Thermoanaerobaculia bacterium]
MRKPGAGLKYEVTDQDCGNTDKLRIRHFILQT